jgi:hypothetical protein
MPRLGQTRACTRIDREEGQDVGLIALGIGLLLLGLFVTVIVCSRMNDPVPPGRALDTQPHPKRAGVQEDPIEGFEG